MSCVDYFVFKLNTNCYQINNPRCLLYQWFEENHCRTWGIAQQLFDKR